MATSIISSRNATRLRGVQYTGELSDGEAWVYDSGSESMIPGVAGGGDVLTPNIAHVIPSIGNDATGVVGDLSKPFATVDGTGGLLADGALFSCVAGDTVKIYEDVTILTTDAAGIHKDGVSYEFVNHPTVTKTSAGPLWYKFGLIGDVNIKGTANIIVSGATTYIARYRSVQGNVNIEVDKINLGNGIAFNIEGATTAPEAYECAVNIKFNEIISSSSTVFLIKTCSLLINGANIINTGASPVFSFSTYVNFVVTIGHVTSTMSNAIGFTNLSKGVFNIGWCQGSPYSYNMTSETAAYGSVTINGDCDHIYTNHHDLTHCGSTNHLTQHAGGPSGGPNFKGTVVDITALIQAGYAKYQQGTRFSYLGAGTTTEGNGFADIVAEPGPYPPYLSANGGTLRVTGAAKFTQGYGIARAQGGHLIFDSVDWICGDGVTSYSQNREIIEANSGRLTIKNSRIKNNFPNQRNSTITNTVIEAEGAEIVLDSALLQTFNPDTPVIRARLAPQDIQFIGGGLSTGNTANGGVLPAKKQKISLTPTVVGATSLTINGLLHTATLLSTKATIAADLVALVNAGAQNVNVIATQDNPGVDDYFYVEAIVAGDDFLYPYTNLVETQLVPNGHAITNISGGQILQNVNIT